MIMYLSTFLSSGMPTSPCPEVSPLAVEVSTGTGCPSWDWAEAILLSPGATAGGPGRTEAIQL